MADTTRAPLAFDASGNPLDLPEEADGWRVKRHTGGRPRQVLGPDRQPLRIPLEATADDLADMLGPGTYRLEAVDDEDEAVDCVVTACVAGDEPVATQAGNDTVASWPAPSRSSDLRAALDANAAMARALTDAVRVLAEAQADWTKGLAVARAIPRNAKGGVAMLPAALASPAPPVVAPKEETDEDEDEDGKPEGWMGHVATFVDTIGKENVPHLITTLPAMVGEVVDRIKKPKVVHVPTKQPPAKEGDAS